jgi:gliding motility-associated-like protein
MKIVKTIFLLFFTHFLFAENKITTKLDFIKNEGQWESQILYKVDLHGGGWAFLENNGITYKFLDKNENHPIKNKPAEIIKGHAFKVKWVNANPQLKAEGQDKELYYNNYFSSNDKSKWKSNIGIYQTVFYHNVYSNIDFKIYSENSSIKSDYIVHKSGNPNDLKFVYDGLEDISIEENGRLKLTTSINTIYELKPYAYQIINGEKKEIACRYAYQNKMLTFILPNGYNKNYDLVIDPTLIFSTYSGSFSDNWGSSATHDNYGNMFLGGIALGAAYPTTVGAFQTNFNGGEGSEPTDVVITKFNATGSTRLYSTYLGGSSNELLASLLCTPNNELIAVMTTSSLDFPTTSNAYSKTFNGGSFLIAYDIFMPNGSDLAIAKFNDNGTALIGSTYFGGTGNDGTNLGAFTAFNYGDQSRSDVAIDNSGNIYVTSTTNSTDLPNTAGKAQPAFGGGESDGFVAKLNSDLSALSWATYYGGADVDVAYSMSIDKSNNIFICGGTSSTNLPNVRNGLHPNFIGGVLDGYVAKINNAGTSILASTYLGTSDYDQAFILDLDNNDNVGVFGQTLGNFPVSNGVYSNIGGKQFIQKLNNNLNSSIFSTVFGSENSPTINITPTAFLIDVCNNIYAAGWGGNVNYTGNTDSMAVTADAYKKTTDKSDFYLINLNANASSLKYATYFGEDGGIGDHVDGGTSRFDKNGIIYQAVCASCSATNDFPITAGVVGPDNNSNNCNMAGFKFKFDLTALQIITATATPASGCAPLKVNFSYTASALGSDFFWDFGDNNSTTNQFPSHTYNNAGTYSVRFIIKDPNNCNPIDSTTLKITVGTKQTTTIDSTICQGQTVTINQQQFSTSGTYRIILKSAFGCDSIIQLLLKVNDAKENRITTTICKGTSITIGNQQFSKSGNYTIPLTTTTGCDSIILLTLQVSDTLFTPLQKTICVGQSYAIGNNTYFQSGNYSIPFKSFWGCDSVVKLKLTVVDTIKQYVQQNICNGDSIKIGTTVIHTAGNYIIPLHSYAGCDSVVNLSLTVLENSTSELQKEICQGTSYNIGNQTFTNTGEYFIHLQASNSCDSTIKLTLTVNPLPKINAVADKNNVYLNDQVQLNILTDENLNYNWMPSNIVSNSILQNPTSIITAATWFYVIATNPITKCTTTDSVWIGLKYLPCNKENIYIPNAFSPNGDGINDIFIPRSNILKSMKLVINDRWGHEVFESNDINKGWDGNYKGQPAQVEEYGYYFMGECLQGDKIIIKGNVSLLR